MTIHVSIDQVSATMTSSITFSSATGSSSITKSSATHDNANSPISGTSTLVLGNKYTITTKIAIPAMISNAYLDSLAIISYAGE